MVFLFWVERLWDAGLVVVTAAGKQRTKGRERHDTGKQPEGDHSWGGQKNWERSIPAVGRPEIVLKTGSCRAGEPGSIPCNYLYPVRSPLMPYIPKTGTSKLTPVVSRKA